MIRFHALAFLLFWSVVSSAQQVKILFDATKAESAGNADWIIDADIHNLGYQYGPGVAGEGNESNPLRYPTPDQSTVTQSSAEDYWEGGISAWGIALVQKGYHVETLPYSGMITYGNTSNAQDLSNYDVFIVCEPNILFTAAEKSAIMHFVQNGGGLFMISDHTDSDRNNDGYDSPYIWDDFLSDNGVQSNPFGMTFDLNSFSQTTSNLPNLPGDPILHGPAGNVAKVQWSSGTSMTLSPSANSSVKGVVYKTGSSFGNSNVMVAYATYGSGRVVGFGDSSPFDDGSGDANDQLYDGWLGDAGGNHRIIIMNASIWLASSPSTSIRSENQGSPDARVFPNPASGEITVEINNNTPGGATFILYDCTGGMKLNVNDITDHTKKIPVSGIHPGFYFYRIANDDNTFSTGKIIIQ